jgi:hypothetical protein
MNIFKVNNELPTLTLKIFTSYVIQTGPNMTLTPSDKGKGKVYPITCHECTDGE